MIVVAKNLDRKTLDWVHSTTPALSRSSTHPAIAGDTWRKEEEHRVKDDGSTANWALLKPLNEPKSDLAKHDRNPGADQEFDHQEDDMKPSRYLEEEKPQFVEDAGGGELEAFWWEYPW